ncbi:alternative ribosome-rescue factor A [Rahnella bonaserana]|jgi:alternative ribosome-rescue factor|uniref:Ribosome alternative rescue factor ArfA n=2 Tax=Rahnella TaxID=34037 RepID=A0ABS6LP24_9GAMM|nr:ribosome alternative rescue factor ArfA [Rahnella bonaserana]MBU9853759.1 ribosome alternative rescue factor ArfA [Rahnella bonaserana]MCL9645381.1 ribosome alternative rescue factor ArfA [Rahnella victoriana]WHZ41054.1 ribosome alternative rescue factor ArfA [Rahnella bonaserana]
MTQYKHQKGIIQDNALQALLHDPLFKQRIEKNQKGKGSYRRKEKNGKGSYLEGSVECSVEYSTLPFLISQSLTDRL